MKTICERQWLLLGTFITIAIVLLIAGCSASTAQEESAHTARIDGVGDAGLLLLPELEAAELNGQPLKVIATTSIIGDTIAQVGGETIALTTLMGPGQDPHSYEPGAQDLTAVAQAHVIFVNGWDLEEGLVRDLEEIGEGVPLVAISANIAPLAFGAGEHTQDEEGEPGQDHNGVDPHVWFSIHNVEQWVKNVQHVLGDLDPANAGTYENNANAYSAELEALEEYVDSQLAGITEEKRFLVTNHDSLSYLAKDYGFEIVGTIIPAASTLAEPSASDLAGLIEEMEEHGLCAIYTESTVGDTLAQTVAGELEGCDEVQVVKLYTGAVGPPGSGADTYIGMFRANVETIITGLG